MPPKKKGKVGVVIDGVDTTSMTREALEIFCLRIKEENEREREERNYFQMERDKLRTFWEITRNELEESKAKLRNKDREIEEAAEKNEEELKNYKQKVKHMQYEHQNNLTETKAEALVSLKNAQDNHMEQERELLKDKRNLKLQMREINLSHEEEIRAMKLKQSEELGVIKKQFEDKTKEVELKYERINSQMQSDLNIKHEMEITEVEERKNTQIAELTKHHERAFNEIKNYYNDITLNNLALISSMKDQMEILRNQNERMTKQVADLTNENKRLSEPLKQALGDVAEFKRQLQNYEKDKNSLSITKNKLRVTSKKLENLKWLYDSLELRFEQLQQENKELQTNLSKSIIQVQKQAGVKNVLLQKRLETLTQNLETKEVLLEELTRQQPEQSHQINEKLKAILNNKNTKISDLQYELARVYKAHDDLLRTYEEKLMEFGIPKEELGFIPLEIVPEGQGGLAKGPAGLVTK